MYSDPTGEHSSSVTCGDPTCTQCRSDRRKFINEYVDWYNRVTGKNIGGVSYTGEFWSYPVYETDKTLLEYKVVHTISQFFSSFEVSADIGAGVGVSYRVKELSFSAISKSALQMEISAHDGFEAGIYSGNDFSILLWDFEMSSFQPLNSDEIEANVGLQPTVSVGIGNYFGVGASCNLGFNYGYFSDKLTEIWGVIL